MDSTVAMSPMDFRFSLAHPMIGKFSNRKRAIPTSRPSKRSKGESFEVVDHLPQFAATRARCAVYSFKKIENRTFVHFFHAMYPFVSRRKEIAFIYITPTSEHFTETQILMNFGNFL